MPMCSDVIRRCVEKSFHSFAMMSATSGATCVLDSESLVLSKDGSMVGFKGPRVKIQKLLRSVRLVTTGATETKDSVAQMFEKFKPIEQSMCGAVAVVFAREQFASLSACLPVGACVPYLITYGFSHK